MSSWDAIWIYKAQNYFIWIHNMNYEYEFITWIQKIGHPTDSQHAKAYRNMDSEDAIWDYRIEHRFIGHNIFSKDSTGIHDTKWQFTGFIMTHSNVDS